MRVNVTTTEGTQAVVTPSVPSLRVDIHTQYAQNFARPEKPITGDEDAVAGDQFKLIQIDASVDDVTYTIDPALFTGLTLHVRCKDVTGSFVASVAADSGTIQLINGEDQTTVQLLKREMIKLYSDGTNLQEQQ